ncbi:MAG: leucine-rich repeat protein [Lachnospiraceae bacterium]|nr:leucine-rich repeat protein [Lachnospiraceae bacterium]
MSYGTTDISGADQGAVANYGAFESALLTQLTLDNLPNLEVIGNESFKKSPLESLTLTNLPQLQVIGERSFQNAKYLTDLDLSNLPSLEIIGDNAFEQAPIETLNLQGDIALKKICYEAFYKNRLTTVDLSNLTSLEIIGSRAFSDGSAPGTAGGGGAAITSLILSNTPSLKIIGSVDGGSLGDDYKKATYYLCGEGCRTFYGASLTSLDLSGCPNLESVGYASFMNSPIEELDFTGLNKLQYIGMLSFGAFAGTQITISDLPELYEIGGLAFSSGRVTSNLTEITIENLPKLTYLSEQQAFKYDSDGNRINDFQGYNTTHYSLPWGSGTGFDTGNQAKRAYNKLTSLTLKNLPELNNIPPYIFFASPLTSLTLEDLGIYAIGYNAFQNAQVSALDLSNGLTNLATIDYQAFRNVPITQLDVLNLPNLKRIFPEAFLYSSLTYLDLSDTTDFIGFPTYVDIAGVYHKSAFGDVDDNSNGSQLGFVIIGGISPENTTDNLYAENYVYQGTTSQASLVPPTKTIINDADMAFVDQTFNKNNYVPVYISGDTGDVVTQDGYNLNPINVKVNYVYIGDGESDTGPDPTDTATYPGGENDPQYISDLAAWRAAQPDTIPNRMLRPEAVVRSQYDKVTHSVSLIAPQIAGYKLVASNQSPITVGDITFPSEENLADPDWVEPGNEFTFYYEKDTTSVNAVYTLTESGVKVYDEIGKLLETSWSLTNGSNDPNLAIGAGWSVQLTYDPLRVQFMGASSSNSYTYTNDSLAGVVTFTFTRDLPAGTLSPTCFWQLIPGRTEMDREFPIYASLITPSHTVTQAESDTIGGAYEGMAVGTVIPGRPVVEADPVTYLKGMYRTPDFTKFARPIAKKATTKQPVFPTSTDDVATFEGGWDPDEKQFNNYDNFTMVYTFKAGQNRAFKRNISGITYTDTLPIYYVNSELYLGHTGNGANGTEVQAIAAFDPAKNPGWEVTEAYDLGADGLYGTSDDGRTYIYVEDPDGDPDTADGPLAYYVVSPARQDIYDEDNDGDTTETIPEVRSYYPNPTDLTPTKVSYTYDKLCTMTPPSATLYLDFPYAWEDQEFTNSANFTAPIYRAAYGDLTEFSGADSIKSLIVGVPPGNFVKEADKPHSTADVENGTDGLNVVPASPSVAAGELDDVYGEQHPAIAPEPITDNAVDGAVISDYQGWFYDSSVDKNQSDVEGEGEQRWYITLSGKDSDGVDFADGSYFKDVAFTDTLYDSRLRFKAISVNDFKPATVTAYDAAGNVLYSKSGVTGRVNFPNNIRDDIAKVTVTDSKVTVRSGEVKGIYVYTELRDPSITWEGITGGTSVAHNDGTEYAGGVYDPISRTADDYFWNLGEANRTLVTTTTDSDTGVTTIEEYKQHVDSFDSIRIHNLTEGLGIEKWSSVASGSSFIAGDPVDYTIKINTFDAGTLKEISCDQVDMELDNVVIIDVLPSVYIDYKFTPSAKLLLAATDGPDADDDAYTYEFISDGYTDDAGKTYNILKITIDHLDVSALYTSSYLKDVAGNSVPQSGVVGKISGKIDESAGATTVVNRVFMDYDPQPGSVINIGKGTESYTPEAQIANPNDDPNDPNDNFIPNPDYNPNDAISAGIIDGYNPFHTTPTPGDTSDDIIVGTDVGITGVTRQLIAQKSIQTTTSYTGTYPNGKHNYGGWKTTPPSKNGEAVTLAGVNTGGVAQQWAYDFQYRLRVTNNTDQAIEENDFEILDILPRRNDHTIIPDGDGVWAERYSEFENEVVSVETPVYYDAADTTHSNPYHYTVKFLVGDDAIPADLGDIAQRSGGNLIGTPDGIKDASDVEYWYLNPPAGYTWYTGVLSASSTSTKDIYELIDAATYAGVTIDPAKVLAIRIKGSPNIRVLENSSLDVIVNMHAPDEGEDQGGPAVGARAINNFVWKCNTQAAYLEVPSVYNEIPPFPASVHVKKTSAGSNAALAGAKFGIYDTGGDTDVLVQVKTSNATGDITFTNLMPGSYVIKEIEAPKGYALNTDSWEVTVQTKSVAWDYYVSAVPYSDGSSAAGAVSPSSAPAGMAPVTNTPLPTSISLQKVGLNEAGDTVVGPLSGAKFGLYSDLACTTLIAEQTTNSGGFAFWDGLMPGTYYVKEISAPTGFVPDTTTVYTVVVTEGATHVESIQIDGNTSTTAIDAIRNAADQRHVVRGNLTLKKLDGVDGDALAGATFKITRVALTEYSDFLVSKTNPVDLTKLKTASEYKAYTTTVTTDANGEIILTDLLTLDTTIANLTNNYDSLGGVVYTIEETVAPGKLEKIKLQVVVYKDYCMVVPGSVMYYDTAQAAWTPVTNAGLTESDVADDNGSTALTPYIEIDITNPLAPVTISKLGLDINNTTAIAKDPTQLRSNDGTPLSGVTFEIWEKGGGALGADLQIGGTYTTNNAGLITVRDLKVGTVYLLKETSIPQYYQDATNEVTVFKLDALGNVLGFTGGGIDDNDDTEDDDWAPYTTGNVMVKNIPLPVPAQLIIDKKVTYPDDGVKGDTGVGVTSQPFSTTEALGGIKFYIEKLNYGPNGVMDTLAGPDMIIGTDDDTNTNDDYWEAYAVIVTSDGTVSYTDTKGTLNPADDVTGTLPEGRAYLGGLYEGWYRIKEQPVSEAPINGKYLAQTVTRTFNVKTTSEFIGAATTFTYTGTTGFMNYEVEPIMVKGDYVGTFDPNDSYEQKQLATAYKLLDDAGENPHEMIRNDGKIDLVSGLGGAVFVMKEHADPTSAAASNVTGAWIITSKPDGTFDFANAATYYLSGPDGVLDENHGGEPGVTSTDDVMPWYPGPDGILDTTHGGSGTSSDDVQDPPFTGFNSERSYSFQEILAVPGYDLNTTITYYYPQYEANGIRKNGGKWISLENRVTKHSITVSKYATDTNDSLAGTTFALYYPDGTQVMTDAAAKAYATFTTDADGILELTNIAPGTYYLKEVSAPFSLGANGVYDSLAGPDGIEQTADDILRGDDTAYEVKTGYYKIVIDGSKDVGGPAPESAHQTDKISPFTQGASATDTGDPATYHYDGTDTLNTNYTGPNAAGRSSAYDEYTNAYNYIYSPVIMTSAEAYPVVYDRRLADRFTLTIAKRTAGEAPADQYYYFRVEFSDDDGATWSLYEDGRPYILYQSDTDDMGIDMFVSDYGTTGTDLIRLKANEHATISAGLEENTLYRVTEVDEDGNPLDGWYANVRKTWSENPSGIVWYPGIDGILDASHGGASGNISYDDEIDIEMDAATLYDPSGIPQDRVTGKLDVLETHGDNLTTDPDGDNDEGHHVVEYRNQKSVDFEFEKLGLNADGGTYLLPGVEFTVYRCKVIADCDDSVTDYDDHVAGTHGDFGSSDSCWEPYFIVTSDEYGRVYIRDLVLYGDSKTDNDLNTVEPFCDTYILAETGTPVGFNVPFGYWVLTIDPSQDDPEDQIQITAGTTTGMLPPAFALDDFDEDPSTPDSYQLTNRRASQYPMTGGANHAPLFLLLGAIIASFGILFAGFGKKPLAVVKKSSEKLNKLKHALISSSTLRVGFLFIGGALLWTIMTLCVLSADTEPDTGSITIIKYVGEETENRANGKEITGNDAFFADTENYKPIEGISFKATRVTASSTAADSDVLITDLNEIKYIADSANALEKTATTNADGKALFSDLPLGDYLITELADERVKTAVEPFLIKIPTTLTTGTTGNMVTEILYDITVYPKNELVEDTTPTPTDENPPDTKPPDDNNPSDDNKPPDNPSGNGGTGTGGTTGTSGTKKVKTGDNSNLYLFIGVGAVSLLAIIILIIVALRKRRRKPRAPAGKMGSARDPNDTGKPPDLEGGDAI